jgi:hypothetical protein
MKPADGVIKMVHKPYSVLVLSCHAKAAVTYSASKLRHSLLAPTSLQGAGMLYAFCLLLACSMLATHRPCEIPPYCMQQICSKLCRWLTWFGVVVKGALGPHRAHAPQHHQGTGPALVGGCSCWAKPWGVPRGHCGCCLLLLLRGLHGVVLQLLVMLVGLYDTAVCLLYS